MREILAYELSDGRIFSDESSAEKAEADILGEEVDGLLKLFNLDITRTQEYKAVLHCMKDKKGLLSSLRAIEKSINHSGE